MENEVVTKVRKLEELIVFGTDQEVADYVNAEAPFDYTARALGYACLYGSYEKVKSLLDAKASFKTKPATLQLSEYVSANHADFKLMPVETECIDVIKNNGGYVDFHFDYSKERYGDSANWITKPRVSDEERKRIIELLLDTPKISFDADKARVYAHLWNCIPAMEILDSRNVDCSKFLSESLISSSKGTGKEIVGMLKASDVEIVVSFLKFVISSVSESCRKNLEIGKMYNATGNLKAFLNPEVLDIVFEYFGDSVKFNKVVSLAIESDNVEAIVCLHDKGAFDKKNTLLKCIDQAIAADSKNVLAQLMSYSN